MADPGRSNPILAPDLIQKLEREVGGESVAMTEGGWFGLPLPPNTSDPEQ